jgi:hypothetical protein
MITKLVALSFLDKALLPQSLAELKKPPATSLRFPYARLELGAYELDVPEHLMPVLVTLPLGAFLALKPN